MRTVFIVCKANFKRLMSNKPKFIINLLFPILVIMISIFVNSISKPEINLGIVQSSNFKEGSRIVSLLKETNGLNVEFETSKLVKTDVILGKYAEVITIKKAFKNEEAIKNIDEYFSFYNVSDKNLNKYMKGIISSYLVSNKPIIIDSINAKLNKGNLTEPERIVSYLATVLLITCVINGALIIKDKEENTFNRFLYSPSKNIQYVLGNVLYNYILSYVQVVIAVIVIYLFGINIGLSLKMFLLCGLILVLVTTTFGTLISCIFKKELYANLFAGSISIILSLLGGTFIVYDKMPKGMQILSNITPVRWIITCVTWFQYKTSGGTNPIFVLLLFSALFSISAAVFSKIQKVNFR